MIYFWLFSTLFTWVLTFNRGALTPTIALSLVLILLTVLKRRAVTTSLFGLVIFLGFSLTLIISGFLNVTMLKLPHLIALLVSGILFLFIPFKYMQSKEETVINLSKICASVALTYALILIFEYSMRNFFGVSIREIMPIFFEDNPEPMFLGQFYRARGFASEPGHAAFSLTVLALLGWHYRSKQSGNFTSIWLGSIFLAILMTASPVPLLLLPLSIVVAVSAVALFSGRLIHVKYIAVLAVFIVSILVVDQFFLGADSYFENQVISKLTSFSMADRLSRLVYFSEFLRGDDLLFGVSPGASASYGQTQLSLYPLIFMETGLVGFSFLCFFVLGYVARLLKRESSHGTVIALAAIIYVTLNGVVLPNYYYPAFWLPFLNAGILLHNSRSVSREVSST